MKFQTEPTVTFVKRELDSITALVRMIDYTHSDLSRDLRGLIPGRVPLTYAEVNRLANEMRSTDLAGVSDNGNYVRAHKLWGAVLTILTTAEAELVRAGTTPDIVPVLTVPFPPAIEKLARATFFVTSNATALDELRRVGIVKDSPANVAALAELDPVATDTTRYEQSTRDAAAAIMRFIRAAMKAMD